MVSKYSSSHRSHRTAATTSGRAKIVLGAIYLVLLIIIGRLFYWQILAGSQLKVVANEQYSKTLTQKGERGEIYTHDGYLLVGNAQEYRLVAYPPLLTDSSSEIVSQVLPLLLSDFRPYQQATESATQDTLNNQLKDRLMSELDDRDREWASLFSYISEETKTKIEALDIKGIGFEGRPTRLYPEASMAAHVTGFMGRNDTGDPTGYFGIEGGMNKELAGRDQQTVLSTDALGFSLFGSQAFDETEFQGRDVVLTIRRDLQRLAENALDTGIEQYGAQSGEVIIMEPSTGRILALATNPHYDQQRFAEYDTQLYKNPAIVDTFEPGSIMKPLTVSAGVDAGLITPETTCPTCDGPRKIGKYTIRTWNDEYHPNITIKDALAKSDNVAMIYVAEQLGTDRLKSYLKQFGIGEELHIDLQEDTSTPFPQKWGQVELATRSFGQGISTTSLQMVRAIAAIANNGILMQPRIVEEVREPSGEVISVEPRNIRSVISPDTARTVTEMMVYAAESGEAQWTYSKTHSVAAKTGTSQIPKPDGGGYEDDATITSFIGFAPPENPQFVMLVKLVKPTSSPWAAETAAPLWYKIAEKVFLLLNIPPDK